MEDWDLSQSPTDTILIPLNIESLLEILFTENYTLSPQKIVYDLTLFP